ncbi:hypothetical protein [Micrococcus lylae]|uniref:hypothetical protein n=1 Tax=Micrococcus lylae TaxID=1273 RepID=UPI0011AF1440|nr:hypothetical protein [Micrococcus lylae]WIK81882.1 hypothetical protein CJ228_009835 [Micrococcus lylae]
MRIKQSFIAMAISVMLLFSVVSPSTAVAADRASSQGAPAETMLWEARHERATTRDLRVNAGDMTAQLATGGQAETQGLKSEMVKVALRGVAGAMRGGGQKFVTMADGFLDKRAADVIRRDSVRIADAIDDVANIPDVATHQVRSEVYKRLSAIMDDGTANVIANAVEGVLWVLL